MASPSRQVKEGILWRSINMSSSAPAFIRAWSSIMDIEAERESSYGEAMKGVILQGAYRAAPDPIWIAVCDPIPYPYPEMINSLWLR